MNRIFLAGISLFLACMGCHTTPEMREDRSAPLFPGMGSHHRPVSGATEEAQRCFDQGLAWTFAFNHDEAIRSYRAAARLAPECAMAWWGIALCNGPHINSPAMSPAQSAAAWEAIVRARSLAKGASALERALIEALATRYAHPAPEDRRPLDEAYAAAMGGVWRAHPGDADVGALYAESLMDLQPWDLWEKDGRPKGATTEIVAVLERVLEMAPNHPGACHFYIHTMEASPDPGRATAAADRLRGLVPASGHLTHMPAHIYVKTGRWKDAVDQNLRAMEADRRYRELSPRQGFYRIYMAHNPHFLAFASMMSGQSQLALEAARSTIAGLPEDYARENAALVEQFTAIVPEVLMRFGRWDDILKEPQPPEYLPITNALWRFARGVAFAAKGQLAEAEREQARFEAARTRVPADAIMAINPAHKVLGIAALMLSGEIAFRRGSVEEAVRQLKAGIALEDDLQYMEPPDWIQPLRHTLGAILVSQERYQEAVEVYREDQRRWPENGWSLHGLAQASRALGKVEEAAAAEGRLAKAWAHADIKVPSSCMCVQAELLAPACHCEPASTP